jgi:hypothetical protein
MRTTTWVCDGCGKKEVIKKMGLPENWSTCQITFQHNGGSALVKKYHTADGAWHFCEDCQEGWYIGTGAAPQGASDASDVA